MTRISVVLCAVLVLALSHPGLAKDPFEGTTWHVTVTPDDDARGGGERTFDDTLTFKGGKFASEKMKAKGFDPVDVETDTRPGAIGGFIANSKSDKNGSAKWTGTVAADEIKGDLVWIKADGTVLNFSYSGEKKG